MYYRLKLTDKVRVPAHRFGEDLRVVLLDVLQEQLEGSIDKEIGIFVVITAIDEIGEGEIIPGDGAVYYDVTFEALALRLSLQEIIEGLVVETTGFGAFVSLGPIDAMLHVSQISDDYINHDEKNSRLVCQNSNRTIGVGDVVRARIVSLSLNEREPRESKIGLTMRQPGLGTIQWLDEDHDKAAAERGGNARA